MYHCKLCGFNGPNGSGTEHDKRALSIHRALREVNLQIRHAKKKGQKYIVLGNKKYRI